MSASEWEHRCPNCDLLMSQIERMRERLDLIATITHFADVRYPDARQKVIDAELRELGERYAANT